MRAMRTAICERGAQPSGHALCRDQERRATGLARVGALADLLVKQRTQLMNCTRSLLAELGIIAAQGRRGFAELVARVSASDAAIPPVLLTALLPLIRQIEGLHIA